jgi:hypothetical protein
MEFASPTIEDFIARIDWHLAKALDEAKRAVSRQRSELAGRGMLTSSVAVRLSVETAQTSFEAGVDKVLGELKRAISNTLLDPDEMRAVAEQRLRQFVVDAKEAAQVDDLARISDPREMLAKFDKHLNFHLRQFDVGFHIPEEPEVPPVSKNEINIGSMTGSAIQQGSPNAQQSVQFTLNVETARTALANFETALAEQKLSEVTLSEINAELHTIRAQLSKASPNSSIIQESGRTLRNVTEGIAAGVLTPGVIAAASALWSALGLA